MVYHYWPFMGNGVKIAMGNSTTQTAANHTFTLSKIGMGGMCGVFAAKRPTRGKQLKTKATRTFLSEFGKGWYIKTHVIFGYFFNIL